MGKSYQLPKQKQYWNHLNYSALRGLTFLNLNRRTGRKRRFLIAGFITLSGATSYSILNHGSTPQTAQQTKQSSSVGVMTPMLNPDTTPIYMAASSLFVVVVALLFGKQSYTLTQLKLLFDASLRGQNIRGSPVFL